MGDKYVEERQSLSRSRRGQATNMSSATLQEEAGRRNLKRRLEAREASNIPFIQHYISEPERSMMREDMKR